MKDDNEDNIYISIYISKITIIYLFIYFPLRTISEEGDSTLGLTIR